MTYEMSYLSLVATMTGLMWIPYILDRIVVWGLLDAVGYPVAPKAQSAWAERMKKAHMNAIENLAVFTALVVVAHAAGISNTVTAVSCVVFFWARLIHWVAYVFAVPWVRTLAFTVGWAAQMAIAFQVIPAGLDHFH